MCNEETRPYFIMVRDIALILQIGLSTNDKPNIICNEYVRY